MLEQLEKIHISEIEPLYWIIEDSLSTNQKAKAEAVFSLLSTIAKHRKDLIVQGLKQSHRLRLQEIAYELYDSESYQTQKNIEIKMAMQSKPLPFPKESNLEEFLATNLNILESVLEKPLKLVGRQIETPFGYKCDLVVESATIYYPIELKIVQTNHQVVSQIKKYCFYFYRQLRYDRYKKVQGVVIANGFDSYSINELRKNGVRIFDIIPADGRIELREIKS